MVFGHANPPERKHGREEGEGIDDDGHRSGHQRDQRPCRCRTNNGDKGSALLHLAVALSQWVSAVYFGLIIILQFLLRAVAGNASQQPLILVSSTLAIAALFQPLRRPIQAMIDRRFYRRKYDAARTLEAFSATLHHEVDLSQLSQQILAIVQETMQPAHVSLWLCQLEQEER